MFRIAIAAAVMACACAGAADLHVSPNGDDAWSGTLAAPNAGRTDGPKATVIGARDEIRKQRAGGETGSVVVTIRGGVYQMGEPLVLEPRDSNVAYRAADGESPVLSGGVTILGWQADGDGVWSADVPNGLAFRQLFVNGERRARARTPNDGWFTVAGKVPSQLNPATGEDVSPERTAFVYEPGSIADWESLNEIEVVVYHSWETSRLRIASVDEENHTVSFTDPAHWPFERWGPGQRYFVENAPDALDAPGEWYLDVGVGRVRYIPLPGEDMTESEVVAPVLRRLVELRGDAAIGLPVENVTFDGLSFQHQDWELEPEGHSDPQAVVSLGAAIEVDGAANCSFERCEIARVGEHALWYRKGCRGNRVIQTHLHDIGAGGVRIGEAAPAKVDADESVGNLVDNNHIHDCGHVYPAGVGVWVAQSSDNVISHNEIHGINYSGMSIGWNWNDAANRTKRNVVEHNHVHHVMQGQLNDGGAIYTLGTSPGSIIRNNVFHDIWPYNHIGWGIYLDATTNGYLVENNVVYNTLSGGLMYHNGGHVNVVRNNVFAFSVETALWPCFMEDPNTFERNIVYLTQGQLFIPFSIRSVQERIDAGQSLGQWDSNVYYYPGVDDVRFHRRRFEDWQALGVDANSVIADPKFVDADGYDFRLQDDSPALARGFAQIDTSEVGLYGDAEWVNAPKMTVYPKTVLPAPSGPIGPTPLVADFEGTVAGAHPTGWTVSGEEMTASVRVSNERAASGTLSLKFTDAPGLSQIWQPHIFYQPRFLEGTVIQAFDAYLEPGALFFTEWRDETAHPECIGPTVELSGDGTVKASGRTLTRVPAETWLHVEVECPLGDREAGYTVRIGLMGEAPEVFEDVPLRGNDFQELHWLGFVSTADDAAVFYIDNVSIEPLGG